jgi:hypothetical protein
MRSEAELEQEILKVIQRMRVDFPELIKYLDEMPFERFGGSNPDIDKEALAEYYNSLVTMFVDYTNAHLRINELWVKA